MRLAANARPSVQLVNALSKRHVRQPSRALIASPISPGRREHHSVRTNFTRFVQTLGPPIVTLLDGVEE